uniref:Uncharacterized protein n=1 Tax=Nomascus leucogenys TaxID=61853 RepID=A0A2I3HEC4_NOMLE
MGAAPTTELPPAEAEATGWGFLATFRLPHTQEAPQAPDHDGILMLEPLRPFAQKASGCYFNSQQPGGLRLSPTLINTDRQKGQAIGARPHGQQPGAGRTRGSHSPQHSPAFLGFLGSSQMIFSLFPSLPAFCPPSSPLWLPALSLPLSPSLPLFLSQELPCQDLGAVETAGSLLCPHLLCQPWNSRSQLCD